MGNDILLCDKFDYVVVDEASAINEPLALGPLLYAKKFIMFGDYYELNPIVKNPLAEQRGLDISLFQKLCISHNDKVTVLKKQYRMCGEFKTCPTQLLMVTS